MGLSELLFGAPANLKDEYGYEVVLSPVLGHSKTGTAEVSDNAIEDGSTISDHVHDKPDTFSVETIMADQNDLAAAALSAFFTADKSVKEKIALLEAWKSMGMLLTYSGPVFSTFLAKGYDMHVANVVVTNLALSQKSDTGSAVSVTISLKRLVIATAVLRDINLPQAARARSSRGATPTQSTSASPGSRSILYGIAH